jgi:hypothetical protein
MRALCGSIVAAGALIGLGLTALAFGTRFQGITEKHADGTFQGAFYGSPTLILVLVILICSVFVGLGIAFVGLALHHERRTWERRLTGNDHARPRVGV